MKIRVLCIVSSGTTTASEDKLDIIREQRVIIPKIVHSTLPILSASGRRPEQETEATSLAKLLF